MLSRDDYKKIAAKYAYKDEERALRLIKKGKEIEAAMLLSHSNIVQHLMAAAFVKAEQESK